MMHVLLAAVLAGIAPSPSPAPRTVATQPSDPCGGPTRMLATLNRPTIGYSACAVKAGSVVFEEGYQSQVNGTRGSGSSYLDQYPQSFVRFGVAKRFELDLIGPSYNRVAAPDGTGGLARAHGYSDGGLGFKYEFVPAGKTTFAIDGLYTSPNGTPGFTAGGATATVNLDVAYAISGALNVGTTLSAQAASGYDAAGQAARYGLLQPSFVVTDLLPGATQLYGEYVYSSKLAPDQGGRAFLDGGVQKLLGKRFELDVEVGQSLISDPSKRFHYIGVGIGWELR